MAPDPLFAIASVTKPITAGGGLQRVNPRTGRVSILFTQT